MTDILKEKYEVVKHYRKYVDLFWVNERYIGIIDGELHKTHSLIIVFRN